LDTEELVGLEVFDWLLFRTWELVDVPEFSRPTPALDTVPETDAPTGLR
jgi:hypothetical protein